MRRYSTSSNAMSPMPAAIDNAVALRHRRNSAAAATSNPTPTNKASRIPGVRQSANGVRAMTVAPMPRRPPSGRTASIVPPASPAAPMINSAVAIALRNRRRRCDPPDPVATDCRTSDALMGLASPSRARGERVHRTCDTGTLVGVCRRAVRRSRAATASDPRGAATMRRSACVRSGSRRVHSVDSRWQRARSAHRRTDLSK